MTITASASIPPSRRLHDAPTVELAIPAQRDNRFPINTARPAESPEDRYAAGYADAIGHAVATRQARVNAAMSDVELLMRAAEVNPDGVRRLAAALRAGCPAWCERSHVGEETVIAGMSFGSLHEREVVELTGSHPDTYEDKSVAEVTVEMGTEAGVITDPAQVVLRLADPDDKTGDRQHGWTGTVEQAEQLGRALLAAAELVKASR